MTKKGRPTIYTPELASAICARIAAGESVRKICKDSDMPDAGTIYNWLLDENKKEFFKQYARAKDTQAELMFDELIEIADIGSEDVMRDRLRVDTRKWYLSKVLPKKYGEKLDLTSDGKQLQPLAGFNYVIHNPDNPSTSEATPSVGEAPGQDD